MKIKPWNGSDLEGTWTFSIKLDGVRALVKEGRVLSRKNKPLYNLDFILDKFTDVEVFCNSWEETASKVRTKSAMCISISSVYSLEPLDQRLYLGIFNNPDASLIKVYLAQVCEAGYEGLVLRQEDTWLKVKPFDTVDTKVTGYIEGKGKHKGRLGALCTHLGNVGTGFSNELREKLFNKDIIGQTIEVECARFTTEGKFWHPRFKRLRFDK